MNIRRTTVAVAACATLALGMTACGPDDAPTAVAPSSTAAQTSDGSQTSSDSPTSTDSSTTTTESSSSSSETSSDSSSSSTAEQAAGSPAPGGAGQCNEDDAVSWNPKGSSTVMGKWGGSVDTKYDSYGDGSPVSVKASAGTPKEAGDSYSVDDGYQLLIFDVQVTNKDGNNFVYASNYDFTLFDDKGSICKIDSFDSALPRSERLSGTSLSGANTVAKGKVAFDVPKGKDYSGYTLVWAGGKDDGQIGTAAWTK